MIQATITGPIQAVTVVRQALIDSLPTDLQVSNVEEIEASPLDEEPAGLEPLTYFLVAFAAHLTAAIAHDLLKKIIDKHNSNEIAIEIKQVDEIKE